MKLHHVKSCKLAHVIARDGFIDPYGGRFVDAGEFFATEPLCDDSMFDESEKPLCYLVIDIPDDVDIEQFHEPLDPSDPRTHREYKIPHDVANMYFLDRTVYPCP